MRQVLNTKLEHEGRSLTESHYVNLLTKTAGNAIEHCCGSDLVGPNVVFHHSKLNFKWFDASDTFKWPYKVVRGEMVNWAEHDPRPCQIPPDWSGGYTSIYAAQAGEDKPGMM